MLLGIIADTHDNVSAVERATERFTEEGVRTVVHCGDIIAPPIVPLFEGFEVHAVLGNNDGEVEGLHRAFDTLGTGSKLHGRFADLEFDQLRFAVLHGEDLEEVERLGESEEYEYVLYGHHHEAEHRTIGITGVINPGAHFPSVPSEHQCIVVLNTETGDVEFINLIE